MLHHVAAVVEDDVEGPELADNSLQEGRVGLITDPDRDLIFLELLRGLADVYADDLG